VLTRQEPPEFYVGIVGDAGPRLLHFDDGRSTTSPETEIVSSLAYTDDGRLIVVGLSRARVVDDGLEWTYPELDPEQRYRPMFGRDRGGLFGVLADPRDNRAYLLQPDGSVVPVSLDALCPTPGTGCTVTALPTLGDLDGDGVLEAVVATQSHLWAFHRSGAVADGFPVPLKAEMGPGAPLVTRFTDAGHRVLVVGLSDGTVDAYDPGNGGRRVPGFPLAVGRGGVATPHVTADRIGAIDGIGTVRAWSLDRPAEPAAHLGSPANPSFVVAYAGPCPCEPSESLLDPRETYNWPNPVQDGAPTRIRFELTEPAAVSIRIHSLSGHQVGAIDVPSPATGVPVEVAWDADVPSGVYYARVRATTSAGRSEDRLVKIAVIR